MPPKAVQAKTTTNPPTAVVDETAEELDQKMAALEQEEQEQEDEEAALLRRLQELEEQDVQQTAESETAATTSTTAATATSGYDPQQQAEIDSRSVYVGNVDYSSTVDDIKALFAECGEIKRVTIPQTQFGTPKGFCYVEFASQDSVTMALLMTEREFKGRKIAVVSKRTNVAGASRGGAASRGRGGARGGHIPPAAAAYPPMGYPPMPYGYPPMGAMPPMPYGYP
eukprot:UN03156